MAAHEISTVVGVFDDHQAARRAVRALKDMGFTEDEIGIATADSRSGDRSSLADDDNVDEGYSGEGALTGAAAGAGIGALWGLGILAGVLPAIGPAIAGGTLAVLLSNAAAGAAAVGLTGALIGLGISKDEAEYYESEMTAGRTIVTVNAGARSQEALAVIQQFGGYNRLTRESMRSDSTLLNETQPVAAVRQSADTASLASGKTVQAREEKLRVQKTPVETGEAIVRKEVHTEHKVIDVPVTREEIVIERRPASGAEVSSAGMVDGQEIRIPVKEEKVNVYKETVVAEEVAIGKRQVRDSQRVDETLRKEEIKVEAKGDVKVKDTRK